MTVKTVNLLGIFVVVMILNLVCLLAVAVFEYHQVNTSRELATEVHSNGDKIDALSKALECKNGR